MQLSHLYLFPVKSCRHVSVPSCRVDRFGLAGDRRWMVVDDNARFLTQRQLPRLSLIEVRLQQAGLQLSAPGQEALELTAPPSAGQVEVCIWKDTCLAMDAGDAAAAWLSRFLQQTVRLVYFPESSQRPVDPVFARADEQTAFSDGFPMLLIGQGSLQDLNHRLDVPVPMLRFRPNLVIDGAPPFAEDEWRCIRIGELLLYPVKPCSRCAVPNVDYLTGERGKEPLKTLNAYRRRGTEVHFGQNVLADGQGQLEVGMPVEVLR